VRRLLWARPDPRYPGAVFRTWRQMCDALGLSHDGTVKGAQTRHRGSLRNTLGYLQEMGWIEAWSAEYEANGEGRGILIRLSPRSSVDNAAGGGRRPPRGPRCAIAPGEGPHFFSGEVATPSRERPLAVDVVPSSGCSPSARNGGASVRVPAEQLEGTPAQRRAVHAAHEQLRVSVAAAASLAWARGIEEGGCAALLANPGVISGPPMIVARALFDAALPDVAPRISAKRQAQLEAAAARIDRYSGSGAWVRFAIAVLDGWKSGELGVWLSEPPRSLGALALELRREANVRRHGALRRRRESLRPLAAAEHRQVIKRWRTERRRLDALYPGSGAGWTLRRPPRA
jgi:hypothetical protein